jgi:hypothetical protein
MYYYILVLVLKSTISGSKITGGSAAKLSATVTGRKRLYKDDGTWTWQYPK